MVNTGLHEGGHIIQEEILGPLFLPLYYLLQIPKLFSDDYHNPFEQNADAAGRVDPIDPNRTLQQGIQNISSGTTSTNTDANWAAVFNDPNSPYFGKSEWDPLGLANAVQGPDYNASSNGAMSWNYSGAFSGGYVSPWNAGTAGLTHEQ